MTRRMTRRRRRRRRAWVGPACRPCRLVAAAAATVSATQLTGRYPRRRQLSRRCLLAAAMSLVVVVVPLAPAPARPRRRQRNSPRRSGARRRGRQPWRALPLLPRRPPLRPPQRLPQQRRPPQPPPLLASLRRLTRRPPRGATRRAPPRWRASGRPPRLPLPLSSSTLLPPLHQLWKWLRLRSRPRLKRWWHRLSVQGARSGRLRRRRRRRHAVGGALRLAAAPRSAPPPDRPRSSPRLSVLRAPREGQSAGMSDRRRSSQARQ